MFPRLEIGDCLSQKLFVLDGNQQCIASVVYQAANTFSTRGATPRQAPITTPVVVIYLKTLTRRGWYATNCAFAPLFLHHSHEIIWRQPISS
jgi:hypothetical protein